MKKLRINVAAGYDMYIGSGLSERYGAICLDSVQPCRAVVISDSNVAPLYLEKTLKSLRAAGFDASGFVFDAGEESKNMTTLSRVLEFTARAGLSRSDCIFALGGGVTGDISGFGAGCYMRGISYIQLPTSLLAAVDSSVGGKTAVDLSAGKNLAGLFLQPRTVIFDTDCLKTLPSRNFADGAAEAIKTGILAGEPLFGLWEKGPDSENMEEIVFRCASYKAKIVEADEREAGCRKLLNLGHTAGHGIEKLSGYKISHGRAVAIGTAIIFRYAQSVGKCSSECAQRVIKALENNGLPTKTDFSPAQIAQAALSDKKRRGDKIDLAVPYGIGDCRIEEVETSRLEALFAAGVA